MRNNMLLILTVTILFNLPCLGQSEVEERMEELQEKTKEEMRKQEQEVESYINKQDSLFAEFLKKEWELYNSNSAPSNFKTPKPQNTPQVKPQKSEQDQDGEEEISDIPIPEPDTSPQPDKDISKTTPETQPYENNTTIDFYGESIDINYSKNFVPNIKTPYNNKKISNTWKNLAQTEHQDFINQIKESQNKLKLNGWGLYTLINKVGEKLTNSPADKTALGWFLLNKLGYKSKIGIQKNSLHLLIATNSMLYSHNYLTIDSQKYFTVNQDKESNLKLETYAQNHPDADKKINMKLSSIPLFKKELEKKTLTFQHNNDEHKIQIRYNPNLIDFLSNYPQTDYEIYLDSPMTPSIKAKLIQNLRPLMEGMTKTEAINFLLSFVQKSFQYKRDDENFGREKPMFPEETLYYEYSDCEDRVSLFVFLVRELLDLRFVGLKYPGHLATAVNLKKDQSIEGDKISWENTNYIICDPTYINSRLGQIIPKFKDQSPEIIVP